MFTGLGDKNRLRFGSVSRIVGEWLTLERKVSLVVGSDDRRERRNLLALA